MADFKSLTDEILIEIFGNLSPKMIKTCSLVCKRWDEIVVNTTDFMKNFWLNLDTPDESLETAKELRRKHQSAFIKDFSQDTLDVICKHNLKSLSVSFYAEGIKVSTLIQTLNNLPALMVFNAKFMMVDDDISNTVDFRKIRINLKELRCCVDILHLFDCCTLRTLELIPGVPDESYNYSDIVLDFLSQQKDLKELVLRDEELDNLFSTNEIFGLKFSLKALSVLKYYPFFHYESLIQFLQLQKSSLTVLKLDFCTEPPFGIELIQNFVIENMTKLKHLKLGYSHHFYKNYKFQFKDLTPEMCVAKNLESLDFSANYDLNDAKRFFEMLPNLKRLTFNSERSTSDENNFQLLLHISAINTKLETLSISWIDDKNIIDVHFPHLKELSVKYCIHDDLSTFINRHSGTLEKIIFIDSKILPELAAKEIMNCDNLKSLKLRCERSSSFHFLKWFRDISSKASPFTFIAEIPFEREVFKFPDDKAIWNEKIKSLSEEA